MSMQPSGPETSYAEYFASLSNKRGRDIARWALDHRRHVDADLQDELNDVIADRVKVKGFREKATPNAPAEALEGPLSAVAKRDDRTASAIFDVWWETHSDLRDAMHKAMGALASERDEEETEGLIPRRVWQFRG